MARRLQAMGVKQYRDGFKLRLAPQVLELPYSWRRSRIVFVNSMSDLFHEGVPLEYIRKVFEVMNNTPQHTYQVLTKRSERLKELSSELNWSENIWMGVSVENDAVVNRVADLRETPAKVRFLSCEPLIGPINGLRLDGIHWVIVGGESGPGARPIEKEWIEQIFKKCRKNGVKFFFKQWGRTEFNADSNDPTIHSSHPEYAKGGCLLNGKISREMPEVAGSLAG